MENTKEWHVVVVRLPKPMEGNVVTPILRSFYITASSTTGVRSRNT